MAEAMKIFGQGHIYVARDWQSTSQWDANKIIPEDHPQASKSRFKTDIPQETVQKGQGGHPGASCSSWLWVHPQMEPRWSLFSSAVPGLFVARGKNGKIMRGAQLEIIRRVGNPFPAN